jgi:TrmH family RNA methyltransferase
MITKNRIKFIRSLHRKKERIQHQMFIVEGEKPVQELMLSGTSVDSIYYTDNLHSKNQEMNGEVLSSKEIGLISMMKSPPGILAICNYLQWKTPDFNLGKYILLDRINDPGNLGTIVRIADWFGIDAIVCSTDSVDIYNPKTIQASMGSLFKIPVFYEDLDVFISKLNKRTIVIGADIVGSSLKECNFPENGFLLMGSESHGINPKLESLITHKVTIPRSGNAESLNVAVATGIIVNKFIDA